MKQKYKTQWKATPADKNKHKTEQEELEDKMEIQGKTEELLVKLKICERNMQEFTDSIKRPNLRIMGIEEGEEVQAKEFVIYSTKQCQKFPQI
jgi:hypothetical protein